jgi:hypothetical protein
MTRACTVTQHGTQSHSMGRVGTVTQHSTADTADTVEWL